MWFVLGFCNVLDLIESIFYFAVEAQYKSYFSYIPFLYYIDSSEISSADLMEYCERCYVLLQQVHITIYSVETTHAKKFITYHLTKQKIT